MSAAASPSPASARDQVAVLRSRITDMQSLKLDAKSHPTLPAVAGMLPGGALRQGAAYSVENSATLVMALLSGPSQGGAWCGVVGIPDFGAEAATRFGIDLERLVLVPHPADQWLAVTAALVDVLAVVVTRPPARASDADVARLGARLRQRGSTLIVAGGWPQSEARLRVTASRWLGLGRGHGHLTGREVTVSSSGRTGLDRPHSARLWLPDLGPEFRTAEPSLPGAVDPAAAGRRSVSPRPGAVGWP